MVRPLCETHPITSPNDPRLPPGWESGQLDDGQVFFFRSCNPSIIPFKLHPCHAMGCDYMGITASARAKHYKSEHGVPVFCSVCNQRFKQKCHMQTHV